MQRRKQTRCWKLSWLHCDYLYTHVAFACVFYEYGRGREKFQRQHVSTRWRRETWRWKRGKSTYLRVNWPRGNVLAAISTARLPPWLGIHTLFWHTGHTRERKRSWRTTGTNAQRRDPEINENGRFVSAMYTHTQRVKTLKRGNARFTILEIVTRTWCTRTIGVFDRWTNLASRGGEKRTNVRTANPLAKLAIFARRETGSDCRATPDRGLLAAAAVNDTRIPCPLSSLRAALPSNCDYAISSLRPARRRDATDHSRILASLVEQTKQSNAHAHTPVH